VLQKRQRGVGGPCRRKKLEAKSRLHLDGPRTERVLRLAKVGVEDVSLDVGQIELVEQVVEVDTKLQFRVFPYDLHAWQTKRFAKSCIHIEVAGSSE
jgi:hypothetical protein